MDDAREAGASYVRGMINGKEATTPAGARLEHMLAHLWERRGTDLLLTAGAPPLVRVDGQLDPVPGEAKLLPADMLSRQQYWHALPDGWEHMDYPAFLLEGPGYVSAAAGRVIHACVAPGSSHHSREVNPILF